MVKLSINGKDIYVSDAQAYAINLILSDYQSKHALAQSDEKTFDEIRHSLRKATCFLSPCDMKEIYKAVLYRDKDGHIEHNTEIDINSL